MGIARYISFPLGAAAGGAIVATVGSGEALLFDAGTYAPSAVLLLGMRLPARARVAVTPNFLRELREGWQAWTEHTWVWVLNVWIAFYFLITYAPFFVLGPYIAKQDMGGAGAWGTVITGEGVGASLAIAAAAVIAGFSFSLGSVIYETGVQRQIAPEKLSRVSAYSWMCAMVFLPLGYALAGPIPDAVGMSAYLVFGAVWIVVTTVLVFSVPAVRNYRLPRAAIAAS